MILWHVYKTYKIYVYIYDFSHHIIICIYAVDIDTHIHIFVYISLVSALNIWGPSKYSQAHRLAAVIFWICHWTHLLLLLFHCNKVMLRKESSLACNSTGCRKSVALDQMGLSLCSAGEVPIWGKIQLMGCNASPKFCLHGEKKTRLRPFPVHFCISHHFQRASSLIQVYSIWLQHFLVMLLLSPFPPFFLCSFWSCTNVELPV